MDQICIYIIHLRMCIEKCIDIIKHTDCLQNILFYIATYFRHFTESSEVKIIISRTGFAFQSPQWAGKRKKKKLRVQKH